MSNANGNLITSSQAPLQEVASTSGASTRQDLKNETSLSQALGPVLLLTVIFFILFVARQITGPLLPAIEADLDLSHTQSGLFLLFMGIGFFISQIAAAVLAARWGYRRCILVSVWGTAATTILVGLVDSAAALYLGFLGLGMAGGLYVPAGIALITVLVRPQDWGKAMGTHEIAPNLALICVPFLATMAVAIASWRQGYLCLGAALTLLGVIYLFLGIDADERPSLPDYRRIREVAAMPAFWHLVLLLSLAVGVETGVYAMIPLFLVNERAFDLADANQLLGLSRIPSIIMVLFSGWITDRLNPSATISTALVVTGAAVILLGIGPDVLLAPAVIAQAAASACLFPPILSLASKISILANRALVLSMILALAPVIGGGLIPAAIAVAGDLGSFGNGLMGAGVLTMAGIGLVRR